MLSLTNRVTMWLPYFIISQILKTAQRWLYQMDDYQSFLEPTNSRNINPIEWHYTLAAYGFGFVTL